MHLAHGPFSHPLLSASVTTFYKLMWLFKVFNLLAEKEPTAVLLGQARAPRGGSVREGRETSMGAHRRGCVCEVLWNLGLKVILFLFVALGRCGYSYVACRAASL